MIPLPDKVESVRRTAELAAKAARGESVARGDTGRTTDAGRNASRSTKDY